MKLASHLWKTVQDKPYHSVYYSAPMPSSSLPRGDPLMSPAVLLLPCFKPEIHLLSSAVLQQQSCWSCPCSLGCRGGWGGRARDALWDAPRDALCQRDREGRASPVRILARSLNNSSWCSHQRAAGKAEIIPKGEQPFIACHWGALWIAWY